MAKEFLDFDAVLTTSESDVYVATNKAMTLLIQAVNISDTEVEAELWITNGSNEHKKAVMRSRSITPGEGGVSDTAKHIIKPGWKIRGKAEATNSIMVEVSVLEGM